MRVEKRSPWIVLGLPYPSSKSAAKRAFARRSRQLRKDSEFPWTQEDLAWADAEITLATEDPDSTVAYFRIPADSGALQRPLEGELFVPAPQPLPRRTEPGGTDAVDGQCAEQAIELVRSWLGSLDPDQQFRPYGKTAATEQGAPL